jgi:hypothetical protein
VSGVSADLRHVKAAIELLPAVCRFHGDDFGKLGYGGPNVEPRCESCRPPWWRMWGLAAVERLRADRPLLPRLDPGAFVVVDGPNGLEEWTGAEWNDLAERAERDRQPVTHRFVEIREPAP